MANTNPIQTAVVVGAGSAGYLTAVAVRKLLPGVKVVIVHAPGIPTIGVGESTTHAVPTFLHQILGLGFRDFCQRVKPSWKLGLRLEWGDPDRTHFNYPFDSFIDHSPKPLPKTAGFYCLDDPTDASPFCALMDRGLSPVSNRQDQFLVRRSVAYHIKNELFIGYLRETAEALGADRIEGEMVDVQRDVAGNLTGLMLEDGRVVAGDFFFDCSGFASRLLAKQFDQKFVSYENALYCDSAVVGSWKRGEGEAIRPYTTAETMDHGWCWRIDFLDLITRGYVYSSGFCSDDEAMNEMRRKNPSLGDDLRVIRFPSGRYQNFWVGNVVAIGNASGFVEPLEATALHMIVEQIRFSAEALRCGDCRIIPKAVALENMRFRRTWDGIRDFLAMHFKFNRKLDTPFWKHCREESPLGAAEEIVDYYRHAGPSPLATTLAPEGIFGLAGFMSMLVGQRVPTEACGATTANERAHWREYQNRVRTEIETAMPMRESLARIYFS